MPDPRPLIGMDDMGMGGMDHGMSPWATPATLHTPITSSTAASPPHPEP